MLQTVEQLPNVVQFFATFLPVVAEPVITVPEIVPHDVPARRLCRDTQLAEQLVEVPTTISVASLFLQRLVELGTPVPGVGGRNAGLHGLLHGQGSTATHSSEERISERIVEQIAFPSSEERISERIVEQIVDFTVACGDPQGFRPGQSSSSVARSPADWLDTEDEPGQGVFHTFPQNKKSATQPPHSRSELPPHSSPWTPASFCASMVLEEEEEEECEKDFAVEYVEFDNCLWGREWDPARLQYCWWLASAEGSQVGHAIWRPPCLIGTGPG